MIAAKTHRTQCIPKCGWRSGSIRLGSRACFSRSKSSCSQVRQLDTTFLQSDLDPACAIVQFEQQAIVCLKSLIEIEATLVKSGVEAFNLCLMPREDLHYAFIAPFSASMVCVNPFLTA